MNDGKNNYRLETKTEIKNDSVFILAELTDSVTAKEYYTRQEEKIHIIVRYNNNLPDFIINKKKSKKTIGDYNFYPEVNLYFLNSAICAENTEKIVLIINSKTYFRGKILLFSTIDINGDLRNYFFKKTKDQFNFKKI